MTDWNPSQMTKFVVNFKMSLAFFFSSSAKTDVEAKCYGKDNTSNIECSEDSVNHSIFRLYNLYQGV